MSQAEISKVLDFCFNAFDYVAPEQQSAMIAKLKDLGLDSDEGKEINIEDLREDLKRILALSPQKRTDAEGRRLANAVLYGRRESHYDAKGMEVWDVGEMSEGVEGAGDGEDDWESEPVPWEVGEL